MEKLKLKLLTILKKIYATFITKYSIKSYSKMGEDMILRDLINTTSEGFYIDIGAHHPKRYSNTYYFYKKGWKGINIDALPGMKNLFDHVRPRDINIEIGVSNDAGNLMFYIFNDQAFNTFDEKLAMERCNDTFYIVQKKMIPCLPLSDILASYMADQKTINFMTIDVEGYDLKVLQSNDWQKYRPKIIIVETYIVPIEDVILSPIYKYLHGLGYNLMSKANLSLIFTDKENLT
jgi:FkbM family methyltransferase